MHFPAEDDPAAHKALKARFPNLEMLVDDEAAGEHLCKTSLGNLIRICEPPIILVHPSAAGGHAGSRDCGCSGTTIFPGCAMTSSPGWC